MVFTGWLLKSGMETAIRIGYFGKQEWETEVFLYKGTRSTKLATMLKMFYNDLKQESRS